MCRDLSHVMTPQSPPERLPSQGSSDAEHQHTAPAAHLHEEGLRCLMT
jgi:hypothetical protein